MKRIIFILSILALTSGICWGAPTNFVDGQTVVTSAWLNSVFNTSGGHVHDGASADGHAPKIILTGGANVSGTLPWSMVGGVAGTDYVSPSTLIGGHPLTGDVSLYGSDLVLTVGSAVNDVINGTHGFCPAGLNDVTKFLDSTGHWASIAGFVSGVSSFNGRTGAVTRVFSDYSGFFVANTGHGGMSMAGGSAKYIVQTADSSVPNAQVMGNYSTGLVKNTTSTGVLSIAHKATGSGSDDINLLLPDQTGKSGYAFITNGTYPAWVPVSGTGTVTSASIVSANGFDGTIANASTTPAITLKTSITGIIKGNGTAISAATSGTDYVVPSGITDAALITSDITTNNVSTSKHGFCPKAPNDAAKYLDGTGAYSTPVAVGSLSYLTSSLSSDVTMTTGSTYYDGPSVTLSAGTWQISGEVELRGSAGTYTAKIWDGTNVAGSGGGGGNPSTTPSHISITPRIVVVASGTPVWKISAASTSTGGLIKAACLWNAAGNTASTITAVKIAP